MLAKMCPRLSSDISENAIADEFAGSVIVQNRELEICELKSDLLYFVSE